MHVSHNLLLASNPVLAWRSFLVIKSRLDQVTKRPYIFWYFDYIFWCSLHLFIWTLKFSWKNIRRVLIHFNLSLCTLRSRQKQRLLITLRLMYLSAIGLFQNNVEFSATTVLQNFIENLTLCSEYQNISIECDRCTLKSYRFKGLICCRVCITNTTKRDDVTRKQWGNCLKTHKNEFVIVLRGKEQRAIARVLSSLFQYIFNQIILSSPVISSFTTSIQQFDFLIWTDCCAFLYEDL